MDKVLEVFFSSIEDINFLMGLSKEIKGNDKEIILYRSVVLLLIASWEQFVEQLAEDAVSVLVGRLRDSTTLPEDVRQGIAISTIPVKGSNSKEYAESVWSFADRGWKEPYVEYCKKLTGELNTASPMNIRELFKNILGIRDVTKVWSFSLDPFLDCQEKLVDIIDLRHDIAHGSNLRSNDLNEEDLKTSIEFIKEIAGLTYEKVFSQAAWISQTQALIYSFAQNCYKSIIDFAILKSDRILTLHEIKSLGSSAQGNHNKLCYAPWALLEFVDKYNRKVTDRLLDFRNNKTELPLEILVFDNGEAIPKPGTRMIFYDEIF